MSCTLHDVQEPQSARASTTTSHFVAISWRRSTGATLVKVGLRKRSVRRPRSLSRVSSRSRKTSPRGLMMSSEARRPCPQAGRPGGQACGLIGRPLAGGVEVDPDVLVDGGAHGLTSLVTGWLPMAPRAQPPITAENRPALPPAWTISSPSGRNLGMRTSAGSAGGPPPPVDRAEGAEHPGDAHGHPLGAAPGAGGDLGQRLGAELEEPLPEPGLRPARLPEDPAVLRRDDEDGVGHQRQLRVPHGVERPGHRPGQRLRVPRLLVAQAVGPVAGEERHRRGALGEAPLHRQRLPGRAGLVLGEAERVLRRARPGWPGRSPRAGRRRCCGR